MILAIDAGNTNICIGVFDNDKLVMESRVDTNSARMSDQYAIMFNEIFSLNSVDKNKINGAIISSVVPPVTGQIKAAIEKLCGVEPLIVGPGVKTGLNIKIDDPSTLGADLVCGAVAAKEIYKTPCITIDLGTANKIYALDKSGAFLGVTIAPGVRISFEALSRQTAALPLISADPVKKAIGTNTVDSMRSGVLIGVACMIDGFIERFEQEMGLEKATVVATGGFAATIKPYCKREFILNPTLILEGLRIIYRKNSRRN
ncbi:MAG: type III pantothenate kinase [Ruminiclostridium sp.]